MQQEEFSRFAQELAMQEYDNDIELVNNIFSDLLVTEVIITTEQ